MNFNNNIYLIAEKKANRFNMYCLFVMCVLAIVAVILNEVGLFTQDKFIMRSAMFALAIICIIPFTIYVINDLILKKDKSIFEYSLYKIIIIVISYISIVDLCVIFSFHTIPLLAIPILFASQYKTKRKGFIILLVTSLLLVPLTTYGSFFFGIYDANLLKPLTQEEASVFNNRLDIATTKRMVEVFLHYALPRMLCLAAINFIAITITRNNNSMIDMQIDLNNKVNEGIRAKTKMQNAVIDDLADIIESRDIETGEHIKRTKKYVTILIEEMKSKEQYKDILTDKYCNNVINAAPLHDIGKITVSDLILCKPGKLTDEEFAKMQTHTTKGGEIIKNILKDLGDEDFLNAAYDIAMYHHEKWNGKGYPMGLSGNDIPLSARIMAIADVFDALVAERVYKKPMPVEKAIDIIIGDSGTHFDPNLVEIFKMVEDKFIKVSKE